MPYHQSDPIPYQNNWVLIMRGCVRPIGDVLVRWLQQCPQLFWRQIEAVMEQSLCDQIPQLPPSTQFGRIIGTRIEWSSTYQQGLHRRHFAIIAAKIRGVGNLNFCCNFAALMRYHHLSIVVLVETCIFGQRFATVSTAMGFDRVVRSDATSFSGGIWLLWDSTQVQLDILIVFDQVIYASVQIWGSMAFALPGLTNGPLGWLWNVLIGFFVTLAGNKNLKKPTFSIYLESRWTTIPFSLTLTPLNMDWA
uniref:Uncharacterized protein n=1 Tax=Fagus sylvatica TaxID=28930 RepID=A0A2N9FB83_FAGSY